MAKAIIRFLNRQTYCIDTKHFHLAIEMASSLVLNQKVIKNRSVEINKA